MHTEKALRLKARLPRGFRDRAAHEITAERQMLDTIRGVYESYGFDPLETPAFEYTDALGKFLPDIDRPNEGVFSLQDDNKEWLSLRYDLTAPLARYVAANFQNLPKPFRRYQVGSVWRNEKPGPGRFREFTQFDADTVGSNSPAADAELLMMVCDALEALGIQPGEYVVKVNNRKFLDGFLIAANIDMTRRGAVLRAIDKFDRLGEQGVRLLLGEGRKDESGDFTEGAMLNDEQINFILAVMHSTVPVQGVAGDGEVNKNVAALTPHPDFGFDGHIEKLSNPKFAEGISELARIRAITLASGYGDDRIRIDPSIIRGLDYYTGPVFEAQLTFPIKNEAGEDVIFGSVAGGGRYDDLVARFTGQSVPATGISIGVSRLMTALKSRGLMGGELVPLVFVVTMDDVAQSFETARMLRGEGIRAEAYVGTKKMQDQLKYADKRGAAIALIEGPDERANNEVQLKDLALGAAMAQSVENRADWVKNRPAQLTVKRDALVPEIRKILSALRG